MESLHSLAAETKLGYSSKGTTGLGRSRRNSLSAAEKTVWSHLESCGLTEEGSVSKASLRELRACRGGDTL